MPTQSTSLYQCNIIFSFLPPTIICPTRTPQPAREQGFHPHTLKREACQSILARVCFDAAERYTSPCLFPFSKGRILGKKACLLIKSECVTLNTFSQLQACSPLAVLLKGCCTEGLSPKGERRIFALDHRQETSGSCMGQDHLGKSPLWDSFWAMSFTANAASARSKAFRHPLGYGAH